MTEKTTWSGGLFAIALMACALHLPNASAGDGGQRWWEEHQKTSNPPSNRPPTQPPAASLEGVLGVGADQSWTVANGNYTINHVASIPVAMRHAAGRNDTGWDVLKVEDGPEVVLDGRNQYPTGIEVTGWVRLSRTGSYIRMRVARHEPPIDPKEPGKPRPEKYLQLLLHINTAYGNAWCGLDQDGGALFDGKALRAKSNWPDAEPPSSLSYMPRAYVHFLPGWPEAKRTRIESDMASMPAVDDRWYGLRIELSKGAVRV
ncbi:MAG TPA: hypothetical protein VFC46_04135, partial [Humisphaera sp.]|nr:hypothetical protein [Humisphaera sp.]